MVLLIPLWTERCALFGTLFSFSIPSFNSSGGTFYLVVVDILFWQHYTWFFFLFGLALLRL